MENNEALEAIENAIESDKLVVNYNVPVPTAKETLINTAIGAGVGLAVIGIVLGVGKASEAIGDALYKRRVKKDRERAERLAAKEESTETPKED